MHAYLLIGREGGNLQPTIDNLAKKLQAKIMEFPLVKISDVRSLNSLIRLSFDKPTLIVCRGIDEAGEEALNAFLKNLEEPQENIYFALTAPSTRKVLSTIVSRCQIIRMVNGIESPIDTTAADFWKLSGGQRLAYIDKIKDRNKAIEFAESLTNFLHRTLHSDMVKYSVQVKNLEIVSKTLSGLKANGNVNLQLSNLVAQLI